MLSHLPFSKEEGSKRVRIDLSGLEKRSDCVHVDVVLWDSHWNIDNQKQTRSDIHTYLLLMPPPLSLCSHYANSHLKSPVLRVEPLNALKTPCQTSAGKRCTAVNYTCMTKSCHGDCLCRHVSQPTFNMLLKGNLCHCLLSFFLAFRLRTTKETTYWKRQTCWSSSKQVLFQNFLHL